MGVGPILETAGGGGPGECVGADGLIDPSLFACRASDLQPSRVELAAEELSRLGEAVRWEMTGIAADWASMRPWYAAPEQERLLALMNAPADDARDLAEVLQTASTLLTTYAGELVPIQRTLADLEWRAQRFRDDVRDGVLVPVSESRRPTLLQTVVGLVGGPEPMVVVPWFQDTATAARNRELLAEYAAIVARLSAAADECENGMIALLTDPSQIEDTEPVPAEAFDPSYVEMPWGWPVEEDRNVVESIGEGGRRIVAALADTVLPLLGIDTRTWTHSRGYAVQSWLGMGNALGSVAITLLLPPNSPRTTPPLWDGWLQERYQLAAGLGLAVGIDASAAAHGVSAYHAWEDDPIATGIESVGNLLLMLAPGAGAARFAGMSARTARWARITAAGADFVVPGGSFAVAGSVRVVSNLADAAALSGRIPGLRLQPAGVVDALTDSFQHTPVSDEFFGTTTAERPSGPGSLDEVVTSGEVGDAVEMGTRPDAAPEPTAGDMPPTRPPDEPPSGGGGGAGDDAGEGSESGDGGEGIDPRLLSDRYPGETSSVLPLEPDVERAATYASGDVHRPGWDPPRSPADSYTPGPGEHGWRAEHRPLHREPMKYQMQITGLRPNASGWLPEYYRTGPNGNAISYDGMVIRDGVEVYLEVKNDWSELAFRPTSPGMGAKLAEFVAQAKRQAEALPAGAILEWHVSDPHAAAAIRHEFAIPANGLEDVVVLYTPRS